MSNRADAVRELKRHRAQLESDMATIDATLRVLGASATKARRGGKDRMAAAHAALAAKRKAAAAPAKKAAPVKKPGVKTGPRPPVGKSNGASLADVA